MTILSVYIQAKKFKIWKNINAKGYVYMLRFRKKDSKELIKRMAKTNGCSVSEIRREMQYAIDEARNSDDPDKQAEFQRLFGNKIPSPEEFICVVGKNLKF